MQDDVVIILDLLKDLWQQKRWKFTGPQLVTYGIGDVREELVDNKFSSFFSSEFVDTSVGGNLSPLYDFNDAELIELLKGLISGDREPV